MDGVRRFKARTILPGKASGPARVTRERIHLRGLIDPKQGTFVGPMTELAGTSLAGSVLIFTSGKGSTSWSTALTQACRFGNAPAAIVNLEIDPLIVQGCAMNDIPLVQVSDPSIFEQVKNGDMVEVDTDRGEVIVS